MTRSRRRPTSFDHHLALDGLRGLAVAAVLVFHADLGWGRGGYLGVSAFFTLSGFLITTLLLTEHARTGRIALGAFWVRRARRLLPAAIAAVALGVGYVLAVGDATALDRVRGDALAALAYVANWRFVVTDVSYAELFAGDSPLQHLWSLAIEEQFYVVLPVVAAAAFAGRDPVRRLAVAAGVALVASVATSVVLAGGDADRLYYGSDTRAAELLVGVLLACLHHRHDLSRRGPTARRLARASGPALLALGASWLVLAQTTAGLHPWLLGVHAVLVAVVIAAALRPGPVTGVLEARPLVTLGLWSYGIYLYHWPVYLYLDRDRTGLDDLPLLALRLAVTLALALASHRWLERPIRRGRSRRPARELPVAAVSLAVAAVLVVVSTSVVDRAPLIDFDAAQAAADALADAPPPTAADERLVDPPDEVSPTPDPVVAGPPTPPVLPTQPRVAIFGDSTALLLVPGLIAWTTATRAFSLVEGYAATGCGLGRGGERVFADWTDPVHEGCDFSVQWPGVLERGQPDVAIVQIGIWDVVDRRIPGDDEVRAIGDPVYDDYLRDELTAATDLLLGTVERVVWSLQPPPVRSTRADDDPIFDRLAAFDAILVDLFADDPRVGLLDVAAWLASTTDGTDSLRMRPDGTHFTELTSVDAATWIGPALLVAAETATTIGPEDVDRVPLRP